jgi:CheY-like chemotaxis protein
MMLDAPRLPMAIYRALSTLAAQSRQQADLISLLVKKADEGQKLIATAEDATHKAERSVSAVLDRMQQFLSDGVNDPLLHKLSAELGHGLEHFKKSLFQRQFHEVADSFRMLKEWLEALSDVSHPSHAKYHVAEEDIASLIPTILVVDDDEFQRKMVGQILQLEHYRLIFAASGLEALELIRTTPPDLILMDVMMPGLNGIETLKQIKVIPTFEQVPVVMLTGHSEGPVGIERMKAGAKDFVVNPFDRNTLVSKVASLLSTSATLLP